MFWVLLGMVYGGKGVLNKGGGKGGLFECIEG